MGLGPFMIYLLLACSVATAALCLLAKPLADRLQIFDYPRGGRKAHGNPTPQIGGVAILLPLIASLVVLWLLHPQEPLYLALMLCSAGMGVVGVMDDQSHLSATGRLVVLGVFTLIAFALDAQLAAPAIPWASFGSIAIGRPLFVAGAVLATAGFVSSVNMADGINGLVPSALLIWCLGFDIFGDGAPRLVSLALTGPVAIVLVFNLRGRLFLGDSGTFGVGFVIALLAIASLRSGTLKAETMLVWFFVPVLDCLRVIAARLLRGLSPLRGGKDHFHHILADIFGNRRAFSVYTATILTTSLLAALVPKLGVTLLVALTASGLGFVAARRVLHERLARHRVRQSRRRYPA